MPDGDKTSTAYTDFSDYFDKITDRMWQLHAGPEAGDARALLAHLWALMTAAARGPAGLPLLFSPKHRESLHRLLWVYGFFKQREDENHDELKALTKELLRAWLELAEEGRRHRNELWQINHRLMQKFGEAIEEVTAEFAQRTPPPR